jgi:hypothetical protein
MARCLPCVERLVRCLITSPFSAVYHCGPLLLPATGPRLPLILSGHVCAQIAVEPRVQSLSAYRAFPLSVGKLCTSFVCVGG